MTMPPRVSDVLQDLVAAVDAYAIEVQAATTGPEILSTEGASEIGEEVRLLWRDQTEPVRAAHSAIRMGHFFVLDTYRSLARLTITEAPSVYGPFVLARSLLDAAGWTYWLAEPAIGADRRVQRSIALRVAEGNEQVVPKRIELKPVSDRIEQDRKDAESFCRHHGWSFQPGGRRQPPLRVGAESVPTRRRLIDEMLGVGLADIEKGLGSTLWWFLSGFTHGGLSGLLHAVERNPDSDPTKGSGLIYVRADSFVWLLVASGRAAIATTARRIELFGDPAASIRERQRTLEAQFARYLAAVAGRRLPSG
jgi:hypothetical protein